MKKMTKQELIDVFLEELGDNEILGEWMSKAEIKDKLNNMIRHVTYQPERASYIASWLPSKGTLNFDISKKYSEKLVIVHELLHVLSTIALCNDPKKTIVKCGVFFIKYQKKYERNIKVKKVNNRAINEGITESLAEQITGINSNEYETEKSIYRILTIIINKKLILNQYFNTNIKNESINIFSSDITKKYGLRLGKRLNDNIRKVLKLLDTFNGTDNLNNIFGVTIHINQKKVKKEIYNTLTEMLEDIIDNEHDFMKKIDLMVKCFPTEIAEPIAKKVLNELVNKQDWDLKKKIDILYSLRKEKNVYIPVEILEKMFLRNSTISDEEKIKFFLDLYTHVDELNSIDMIYEIYARSRKIAKNVFLKKDIFKDIININDIANINDIDNIVNKIRYRRIGNYYEICGEYKRMNGQIYDNNGKNVKVQELNFDPFRDETIQNPEILPSFLSKEGLYTTFNEIKRKFEQYKSSFPNEEKYYTTSIEVIGNMLKLTYYPFFLTDNQEKQYKEYFLIKPNGELEEISYEEEKRLLDDRTNLDVSLPKLTNSGSLRKKLTKGDKGSDGDER